MTGRYWKEKQEISLITHFVWEFVPFYLYLFEMWLYVTASLFLDIGRHNKHSRKSNLTGWRIYLWKNASGHYIDIRREKERKGSESRCIVACLEVWERRFPFEKSEFFFLFFSFFLRVCVCVFVSVLVGWRGWLCAVLWSVNSLSVSSLSLRLLSFLLFFLLYFSASLPR